MTDTTEPDLTDPHAIETGTAQPGSIHYNMAAIAQRIAVVGKLLTELKAQGEQLQQLTIQTALACATCYTEERAGTRPGHNFANTTLAGTSYCNEHLDLVNGRLVPKKSSGLIVTGG